MVAARGGVLALSSPICGPVSASLSLCQLMIVVVVAEEDKISPAWVRAGHIINIVILLYNTSLALTKKS